MPATDRVRCVRMAWGDSDDDRENKENTRIRLFQPFTRRCRG